MPIQIVPRVELEDKDIVDLGLRPYLAIDAEEKEQE